MVLSRNKLLIELVLLPRKNEYRHFFKKSAIDSQQERFLFSIVAAEERPFSRWIKVANRILRQVIQSDTINTTKKYIKMFIN